jgi:hypothetical protein
LDQAPGLGHSPEKAKHDFDKQLICLDKERFLVGGQIEERGGVRTPRSSLVSGNAPPTAAAS